MSPFRKSLNKKIEYFINGEKYPLMKNVPNQFSVRVIFLKRYTFYLDIFEAGYFSLMNIFRP